MPSPVGHSLSGLAAYLLFVRDKRSYWLLLCFVIIVNIPDIDFIPGWLADQPNLFHRGLSHSFFMALVIGIASGLVVRLTGKGKWVPVVVTVFSLYSFHIVLDLFSVDYGTPKGFKILWPFRGEHYISPTVIFMDITRSTVREEFFSSLLNSHNLKAIVNEFIIFLPMLLLFWGLRGRRCSDRLSVPHAGFQSMRNDQQDRWIHTAFREI